MRDFAPTNAKLQVKRLYLILKILLALATLVFVGAYFVGSIRETREISKCGFEAARGESIVTIRNGTVARSGDIRIGASVGSDNSFNLAFLDGTEEEKFNVKECDILEYRASLDVLFIKVSKIRSNTNWWSWVPGSNSASVELIILHTVAPHVIY